MADQFVSSHLQALFESALQAYKKRTGITLAEHPLTVQLESFHTVEDINSLLKRRADAVSDFQASERIINSLRNTISILTPLSVSVGLVRQKTPMTCFTSDRSFMQTFPPTKAIQAGLAILLDVRAVP